MEWFNYLLKVSACSALFFAFYLLVLRKLTFFKTNRFYLLFTLILSFVIPALQFTVEREVEVSTAIETPAIAQNERVVENIAFDSLITTSPSIPTEVEFHWVGLLPYFYLTVVLFLLGIATWRLLQLFKHAKRNIQQINGLKIISKSTGFTNCSFFNYVFIDENSLSEIEFQILLRHEEAHVKQYHSLDKIILIIAKAVLWINPIIYLYDKALEQMHEYEADEAASQGFGTETYANLLLRLAITKSEMPLVHNFVKSPIKERIKMLFNSKSKSMKKLFYLLAVPIGLGLLWGFTVKVVDVLPRTEKGKEVKINSETAINADSVIGKKITGKVVSLGMIGKGKIFNLKSEDKIYPINLFGIDVKIKVGDELVVDIYGSTSPPMPIGEDPVKWQSKNTNPQSYIASSIFTKAGKKVYLNEPKHYAFLYEVNRARYAWSKIKAINKSKDGTINKIVLNDKGFTINLNVADQKFKSSNFNIGDEVVVKFIGEKLIAMDTYTTDKMIALYSWPKKYELINPVLYNRFYNEDGSQKVKTTNSTPKTTTNNSKIENEKINVTANPANPELISSTSLKVDNKNGISYVKNGKYKIGEVILEAKESIFDNKNFTIKAIDANITRKGEKIVSDEITVNCNGDYFTAKEMNGAIRISTFDRVALGLFSKVKYNASDSTIVNRESGIISLFGNANIGNDALKIKGTEIVYNKVLNRATIKNAILINDDNIITAEILEVNFNTATMFSKKGDLKMNWK